MSAVAPSSSQQFADWLNGRTPRPEELRPGLWSIPVAFPDNPLRYTLSYALRTAEGAVVIDPGYGSDENWNTLVAGLANAGIEVADVRAVLVTHYHLDHWGIADRLAEAADCLVWFSQSEYAWFANRSFSEFSPTLMRAWYRSLGAPEAMLERVSLTDDVQQTFMHDAEVHLLEDGDSIPGTAGALRARATPGHTDGHLSFVHEDLGMLFGGDHVLPSVSTNVSLTPFGAADPLGAFLASLEELRSLAHFEVLPAHQYRYRGLGARIDRMSATIHERIDFVRELLGEEPRLSAWEVASRIPRKRRTWDQFDALSLRLGLGEAAAYLAHLGRLIR